MKQILLLAYLLFQFAFDGQSQSFNCLWAKNPISDSADGGHSVATDSYGNIIISGTYSGTTIIFDSITLINSGSYDIFLTKYDATGNVQWAKSIGGTSLEYRDYVSFDDKGNIFLTGTFVSAFLVLDNDTLFNSGGTGDVFIAKFDSSGNALWARSARGNSEDYSKKVLSTINGEVIISGSFMSDFIIFENDTLFNYEPGYDFFIAKFDSMGNVKWARSADVSDDDDYLDDICTDQQGNIYITGWFSSFYMVFGSDTIFNISNYALLDIFIAKYDSSGNFLWAKSVGGWQSDWNTRIFTDLSYDGEVYLAGNFDAPNIFFDTITLNGGGIFLAKYDSGGNVLWAQKGPGGAVIQSALVNPKGEIIIGNFDEYKIIFGNDTLTNINYGYYDIFMVQYDTAGNVMWANSIGDDNNESGIGTAPAPDGNIYMIGDFASQVLTLDNIVLNNSGYSDAFIAKYGPCANALLNVVTSICSGDSIFLQGAYQSISGTYYDTLQTTNGCDSIIETTLTVNPIAISNAAAAICNGDSIFLQGAYQTSSGTYYDTLQTTNGCDSIIETTLTVNPTATATAIAAICNGDSIFLQGAYQISDGTYYDTLQTTNGCDSIIETTLSLNQPASATATANICAGDSIFLQGNYQNTAGNFYDTLQTTSGCDSILETTLTVNAVNKTISQSLDTLKADAPGVTYQWINCSDNSTISGATNQNFIPDSNGSYAVVVTENNCTDTSSCFYVNWFGNCVAYFTLYPDTIPQNWFALNQATGTSPINYYWSWGDGDTSIGATPSHIYSDSGFYNICLTIEDSSGCINSYCDSSTYINKQQIGIITINVIMPSTGIPENKEIAQSINIIPNPNNGKFIVSLTNDYEFSNSALYIYNILGEIIFQSSIKHPKSEIDLFPHPKGIYFVQLTSEGKTFHAKLIVE